MSKTTLHIKNMVCPRCVTAVEDTLTNLKIPFSSVTLGEALVEDNNIDYNLLNKELKKIGFELINNNNLQIVEQIKSIIIEFIHHSENEQLKNNFSEYIATKLNYDYSYLSKLFSEKENTTIEKYIILQKIEKVKELISYNELSFSEIAYKLNYNSTAYLSKQFKDIMGLTLSEYKKSDNKQRNTLDKI